MKEVVEYILAALIVMSVIPIYNYITGSLYSPPELQVEQSVVSAFTDQIVVFLNEAALYGNLSSPIVDLTSLIENRYPYFTRQYAFRIEMVSNGIINVNVSAGSIKVYTLQKGNLTLLIVHSDYTLINTTLERPINSFPNGTYLYEYNDERSDIIFVASVLDTGIYRYVDYYESPTLNKVYIGNYYGVFSVITDKDPEYFSLPGGRKGLKLTIVSYSPGSIQFINGSVRFGDITGFSFGGIGFSWTYGLYIYYYVEYQDQIMTYYSTYTDTSTYNGINYNILSNSLLNMTAYDTFKYTYYLWYGELDKELVSEDPISPEYVDIEAPIYNVLLVMLTDRAGNHYLGYWYPHNITIGYTLPKGLPVTSITIVKRLGMVDYTITVYMWRRVI